MKPLRSSRSCFRVRCRGDNGEIECVASAAQFDRAIQQMPTRRNTKGPCNAIVKQR